MISYTEIRYFAEVASTLNVTRAAEKLGVSQPTLSYALKKMEGELGVKLLIRSKSGVALTKAGERVYQASNSLMDTWDKILLAAKNTETEIRGRFTLGCHVSVALYSLPHFFTDLLTEYPGLEVALVHGLSREITSDVIDRKIDFGITINPIPHPDLVITELCRDKVSFWRCQELKNPELLICDASLAQVQALLKDWKEGPQFSRVVTSKSLEVVAALTAQGCGVGILPERVVKNLKDRRIVRLPKAPVFNDRLCLIRRVDQITTAAQKVIIEKIKSSNI